ncbi:hypothetical protein, partial [Halorhodospira halochloris]
MRIEVLDAAENDLIAAANFHEAQQPGLGAYFIDALSSDIDALLLHGGAHERRYGYNRALAKRFPYAIYHKQRRKARGSPANEQAVKPILGMHEPVPYNIVVIAIHPERGGGGGG